VTTRNNLIQTNGYTQTDGNTGNSGNGGAPGSAFYVGGCLEDAIWDHNTLFDLRGIAPQIFHQIGNVPSEGTQFTANIAHISNSPYVFSNDGNGWVYQSVPAISGYGAALWNSLNTNDPNTPSSILGGNLLVPSYNTFGTLYPFAPSGLFPQATIATSLGGSTCTLNNCVGALIPTILGGASVAANVATVGYRAPETDGMNTGFNWMGLNLIYPSPFKSGASPRVSPDGADVGVDMNALLTAQGMVVGARATIIGTTTATISWHAYDGSFGCAVDYAIAPNDPSTQTGGGRVTASAANFQSVNLTGLTPIALYNVRVLCPVYQPTLNFLTR
jgi:hypothetical protein